MLYELASLLVDFILLCIFIAMEFEMTNLEALNYFIGIADTRDSIGMFFSQRKYAMELLERAYVVSCNPSQTHVDTMSKLGPDGELVSNPKLYRSLAANLVQHRQRKHIGIDSHFVCDMVTKGWARVFHVSSRYQYANIFIKGLPSTLFEELYTSFSVYSYRASIAGSVVAIWPPRVTLGKLLPHARGLEFKPRRGGFPSGAKKEWGLSPKANVRVLHTAQLDVTVSSNH
ncbi:ribonuclease H-like domain-containing protein [Tanacetum coccineum]